MKVSKKILKESFDDIIYGRKKWELRLNDFEIKEGDILELVEVEDKQHQPTGRKLHKTVKTVSLVKPTDFYSVEDVQEKGLLIITFD